MVCDSLSHTDTQTHASQTEQLKKRMEQAVWFLFHPVVLDAPVGFLLAQSHILGNQLLSPCTDCTGQYYLLTTLQVSTW